MRVAGIDIGTNTVRLLVSDVIGDAIIDVARRSEVVGLGRGLDRTGRIAPDALETLEATLSDFAAILEVTGPDFVRAVATSASRDAANADELSEVVRRTLGAPPHIVSGEDEAALSFAGARWGTVAASPLLVIDPGGGSTEFVFGEQTPSYAATVDVGSIRLTERMSDERPTPRQALHEARSHAAALFADLEFPAAPSTVIGVAGTFRSLASVHLGLGYYDRNMTHGVDLTQDDLDALVERFASLTVEETEELPALPAGRGPVILGGSIVAAEAVRRGGAGRVTVSKTGLLQGIVLDLAHSGA